MNTMSSGRVSEIKRMYRLHIAFHPKALIQFGWWRQVSWLSTLLAPSRFPLRKQWHVWPATKSGLQLRGQLRSNALRQPPVFPFNLLMISSAEEPTFRNKLKVASVNYKGYYCGKFMKWKITLRGYWSFWFFRPAGSANPIKNRWQPRHRRPWSAMRKASRFPR